MATESLILTDVAFTDLRIGQVVRFSVSGKYGFICQLTGEVPYRDAAMKEDASRWYEYPRYSTITFFTETGRVSTPGFHIGDLGTVMIDRRLTEAEFFHFEEIVTAESQTWKDMQKS